MAQNAGKFSGKSADYARYRERYDAQMILPRLRRWCDLRPAWTVADVGAGTGMIGDICRSNGNPVIAIEPNADMRAMCMQLHSSDPEFHVLEGSAEETGLAVSQVEMIAVGRAPALVQS
jgi:precorrin-6B methylase 2